MTLAHDHIEALQIGELVESLLNRMELNWIVIRLLRPRKQAGWKQTNEKTDKQVALCSLWSPLRCTLTPNFDGDWTVLTTRK